MVNGTHGTGDGVNGNVPGNGVTAGGGVTAAGLGAADVRAAVAQAAGSVPDPEIPVVTIADLGILRGVRTDGERTVITITPTYSGCPAMETIAHDIVRTCARHGWHRVSVEVALSPAWTTDEITGEGRRKLRAYGIAPPERARPGAPVPLSLAVRCPRCGSPDTTEISRFGSTACKSLHVCNACREPFDHFKVLR